MKKTLLFSAILIYSIISAQQILKTNEGRYVILKNDKTWEYTEAPTAFTKSDVVYSERGISMFNKTIKLKNGKNELVDVELEVALVKDYAENLKFDKIESMIESTLLEAKYSLKNKSTFSPIKISFMISDEKGVALMLEYSGQNDYGAMKDATKLTFFTLDGVQTKTY
ncbi:MULTISPECIES: hypothetical protein [unclassified Chryseobacterium]|uniref:hypothetical protein n=1 Tax=unclassified Chryseobacterium TaxID=2593645 RepID=UPI003016A1BD